MNAPYQSTMQAVKAAISVGASSMYKPSSWQALAGSGYRESSLRGDLSKMELFQQACMTHGLLHNGMPPHLWAVLIIKHAPALSRDGRIVADKEEIDRMKMACLVAAGYLNCDRVEFARWAVAHWGHRLPKSRAQWSYWDGRECGAISTLKRVYSRIVKPSLIDMERAAMMVADDLLKTRGVVNQEAA